MRKSWGVPSLIRGSSGTAVGREISAAGSLDACLATSRTSKAASAGTGCQLGVSTGNDGGLTSCGSGSGGGFVFNGGNGDRMFGRTWGRRGTTFGGVVPGG